MSLGTVSIIARREVREMLNDWRIMVPIFLLTFIFPLLIVVATNRVIRFVDDDNLAQQLVPFAVLLVGFIPSSFSLITALESFVGERERNSLEALLATPIDDNALLTGKLVSSLIAPLTSSYIAMSIYTALQYLIDPSFLSGSMTLGKLFLLFVNIGLVSLTMVSGAVVVSSHISSIRAANLMSSFILLPMALVIQFEAVLIINNRWDGIWFSMAAMGILALFLVRTGVLLFNREEILSREHQQESDNKLLGWLVSFTARITRGTTAPRRTKTNHPIMAIAQRELHESLTDWRVLLPSFILTFVIPLALVSGTDFAISFVEQPFLIARVVPFAVLLVGFIPASFSLIVALDSFVGERERNSLEALFAMPISDRQLYISKVISSLVPPITTSMFAMFVFALAMAITHPKLYFTAMTTSVFIQLLLMIIVITVVMVTGAVVISSHTSTIRAANLMASFVLIPMAITIQMQAILIIAERWDVMWFVVYALAVVAFALMRSGIAAFNREEILSREHEPFDIHTIRANFFTFLHEYRPAGIAPSEYNHTSFSLKRFYRKELTTLIRSELRLPLVVALTAVFIGILAGWYVATDYNFIKDLRPSITNYVNRVGTVMPPSSYLLSLIIFFNNLRVSLISNLFSVFGFGLFAFMVPAVAFAQVSFIGFTLADRGGSWLTLGADSPLQFVLAYVIPHGIIELPTFVVSAALGIRLGASLLCPPGRFNVGQNVLWSLAQFFKVWLFVLLPLIFVSSLVEGLITPLVIQALYLP